MKSCFGENIKNLKKKKTEIGRINKLQILKIALRLGQYEVRVAKIGSRPSGEDNWAEKCGG